MFLLTWIFRWRIRSLRPLHRKRNRTDGWTTSWPLSARRPPDDGRNVVPAYAVAARRLVQPCKPFDQRALDAGCRGTSIEHEKPQETDCRRAAGKRAELFVRNIIITLCKSGFTKRSRARTSKTNAKQGLDILFVESTSTVKRKWELIPILVS